jgi:hypothetical protein
VRSVAGVAVAVDVRSVAVVVVVAPGTHRRSPSRDDERQCGEESQRHARSTHLQILPDFWMSLC